MGVCGGRAARKQGVRVHCPAVWYLRHRPRPQFDAPSMRARLIHSAKIECPLHSIPWPPMHPRRGFGAHKHQTDCCRCPCHTVSPCGHHRDVLLTSPARSRHAVKMHPSRSRTCQTTAHQPTNLRPAQGSPRLLPGSRLSPQAQGSATVVQSRNSSSAFSPL